MIRTLCLVAVLALSACRGDDPVDAPSPFAVFRDTGAPIGSTTRGSAQDMAGAWTIAAAYPGRDLAGADVGPGTRVTLAFDAGGFGTLTVGDTVLPLEVVRAGRWRVGGARGAELWLIWTDADFRTAVIGAPGGTFGWIMDRPGAASPDRTRAAREILEFSGYDLTRLSGG